MYCHRICSRAFEPTLKPSVCVQLRQYGRLTLSLSQITVMSSPRLVLEWLCPRSECRQNRPIANGVEPTVQDCSVIEHHGAWCNRPWTWWRTRGCHFPLPNNVREIGPPTSRSLDGAASRHSGQRHLGQETRRILVNFQRFGTGSFSIWAC